MKPSTSSPVALHPAPAAGFDQPFEMLHACHERVQRMLRLLQRLRTHLASVGCDEAAQQAARDVMRYFDIAGPAHHDDEERHLFPALLAAGQCVDTVQRLQREHIEMSSQWQQVRALLMRVSEGPWQALTPDEEGVIEAFARLYDWHIAAEAEVAYPMALTLMNPEAQRAMGHEMAQRRGVPGHE